MADAASVKFAAAFKAMNKAGTAHPEWFDRARDVLKTTDDGSVLLLHAIAVGLKEAYEAGQRGRGLPPLKRVQPGTTKGEREMATAWRTEGKQEEPTPPAATRVVRRPAPAPVSEPKPTTRIVRRGR